METVYQLKPHELTDDFFKTIKERFGDKEIKITIETPYDETAYLLQSEANREILMERLKAVRKGIVKHTLTMDEIEAMAK